MKRKYLLDTLGIRDGALQHLTPEEAELSRERMRRSMDTGAFQRDQRERQLEAQQILEKSMQDMIQR